MDICVSVGVCVWETECVQGQVCDSPKKNKKQVDLEHNHTMFQES